LTVIDEQHFLTKSDLSDRGWNSSAIEALLSTDRYVRHRRDDPMKALGVRFTALYLLKRVLKVEQSPTYAKWQSLAGQEEKDRFLEEVFSKRLARVLKYLDTDTPALQGKSQEQIDYANRVRTKEFGRQRSPRPSSPRRTVMTIETEKPGHYEEIPDVNLSPGGWVIESREPRAGWACVLRYKEHRKSLYGPARSRSEIRMEILGIVNGLKNLKRPSHVTVQTATDYIYDCIYQLLRPRARYSFPGEVHSGKAKNADLWQEFEVLCKPHVIEPGWVPARCHYKDSEAARYEARSAAKYKRSA